jgi:hypothetical protein
MKTLLLTLVFLITSFCVYSQKVYEFDKIGIEGYSQKTKTIGYWTITDSTLCMTQTVDTTKKSKPWKIVDQRNFDGQYTYQCINDKKNKMEVTIDNDIIRCLLIDGFTDQKTITIFYRKKSTFKQ